MDMMQEQKGGTYLDSCISILQAGVRCASPKWQVSGGLLVFRTLHATGPLLLLACCYNACSCNAFRWAVLANDT